MGEEIYKYEYDLAKRLREYRFNDFKTKYNYDKNDNIATKQYILNDITHNIENTYDNNDNIIKKVIDNNEVNYTYDYLGRITNRNINNSYNTDYTYITNGKRTSLLVKTLKNNNDIYKYKYDKLNNITHIYLNDNLINRYYYDNYNELIKEHDYQNNQTIEYTYDNYGNLLSKKIYELNTTTLVSENTYEYSNTNWVDQLTKFNNESITYDAIGNPLTIGNKTLSWIWGRSLYSYNDGTNNIVYKYNKDNIRTIKWINETPTYYYLEGNDIVFEETNNNVIYYIRDINGLTGFKYNDNIYYYVKNLQNDIIGILDSNYQEIAKYKYDSWGNILSILDNNGNDISNNSTHIANINPYRYRSYYYDKETGLYYLNSRYYNPKWGRFLNVDELLIQKNNGNNLYLYCKNNSINKFDNIGNFDKTIISSFVQTFNKIIKNTINYVKKIVENEKNKYPDYTEQLNTILVKNSAEAMIVKNNLSGPNAMTYFYHKVNHNGDWDYKRKEVWESQLDIPYLGVNGKFIYNNEIITAEDFGNLHYGFVGATMGFDPIILYMGGGYAAQGLTIEIFKSPYYGDSINDHIYVEKGIKMYYGID